MAKRKNRVLNIGKPGQPSPRPPSHSCPVCKTAVAVPDDCLIVRGFGIERAHCLRCWFEVINKAAPQLLPLQPVVMPPAVPPPVRVKK